MAASAGPRRRSIWGLTEAVGAEDLEMASLREKDGGREEVDGCAGSECLDGVERVALCWMSTLFESRSKRRHADLETQW